MTNKQRQFVEEYLIDLNATQAAIRAGYSPRTAGQIGDENLKKPEISDAIARAMAERSKRTGFNAERVLQELAKIGFADITDVVNIDDASVRNDARECDTAAIQSIKVKRASTVAGESYEREIRLYDKMRALIELGKHVGLFDSKLKIDGAAIPVVIAGSDLLEDE